MLPFKERSVLTFAKLAEAARPQLSALSDFLDSQISEFEPEIREMVAYCLKNSGKRIRPILGFFAGWTDATVNKDVVKLGAVVEMVHLATLVHDDILDAAVLRHNRSTAQEKYGTHSAVLLGDALFAHALKLATEFPTNEVCAKVAEATRKVCAGEISQTLQRGNLNLSLESYYRHIELKTAELFRVSCYLGAKISGQGQDFADAAGVFGRHLGIAYQIYDDLTDLFAEEKDIGKTLMTDLSSGKYTLPVLLFLRTMNTEQRQAWESELKRNAEEATVALIGVLKQSGILETVLKEHFHKELADAAAALAPFADKPAVEKLSQLQSVITALTRKLKV